MSIALDFEPKLPGVAQEIADVIGREKALFLIGQLPRCGRRGWRKVLYVPHSLKPDHPLVHCLGWRDAKRLTRVFGGEILQPSSCRFIYRRYRNQVIEDLWDGGMDPKEISRFVGVTPRQVRNILSLAETPPEETQNDRSNHVQVSASH